MSKNLNKIVAFAIGVSVFTGNVVPAMAADTKVTIMNEAAVITNNNSKPLLTLEDAMETAVSNSETLALLDKTISYKDKMNDVNDKIYDVQVDNDQMEDDTRDYNQENNDLSIKQLKQKKEYQEDILKNKVRNAYNELVTSELNLENLNLQLDSINKKYSDMQLKNQLGLATTLDADEFQLNVQKLKDGIQSSQNALKVSQYSFKNLTGIDVTKYTLSQDIEYNKFESEGSVDDYLDEIVEEYIEQSYNQKIIDNNKEHLNDIRDDVKLDKDDKAPKKDDYYKTVTDKDTGVSSKEFDLKGYTDALSEYTGKLQSYLQYLGNKLTNISDQTTLNEQKKAFKEALRNYYVALGQQESTIEMDRKNIEISNQKLKNTKLQYDLGLITKNNYDDKIIENIKLQLQLRTDIKAYNDYKDKIEKPWISLSL